MRIKNVINILSNYKYADRVANNGKSNCCHMEIKVRENSVFFPFSRFGSFTLDSTNVAKLIYDKNNNTMYWNSPDIDIMYHFYN